MTDDEIRARLRASFQATAARTTIGGSRLEELTVASGRRRVTPLVATMSAAAAVAAVVAVATVVAGVGTSGRGSVTAASGETSELAAADCVPENYYVIASADQLQGLTYLLPEVPPGYHLYGAWGTISRNGCLDSATWYVEYDRSEYDRSGANNDGQAIQLSVTRVDARSPESAAIRGELGEPAMSGASTPSPAATASGASASGGPPSAPASQAPPIPGQQDVRAAVTWQPVTVAGHAGRFLGTKAGSGTLVWRDRGLVFQLNAPVVDNDSQSLVKVAESLVTVSPSDPRIVAPANCKVPAGSVCGD